MPLNVEDRPADLWEPLLAIADAAGGDWPKRAREACLDMLQANAAARPASVYVSWVTYVMSTPPLVTQTVCTPRRFSTASPRWMRRRGEIFEASLWTHVGWRDCWATTWLLSGSDVLRAVLA
jgi:Protein of unknown function (DUF3631)